jgi:hypothetical protein
MQTDILPDHEQGFSSTFTYCCEVLNVKYRETERGSLTKYGALQHTLRHYSCPLPLVFVIADNTRSKI